MQISCHRFVGDFDTNITFQWIFHVESKTVCEDFALSYTYMCMLHSTPQPLLFACWLERPGHISGSLYDSKFGPSGGLETTLLPHSTW